MLRPRMPNAGGLSVLEDGGKNLWHDRILVVIDGFLHLYFLYWRLDPMKKNIITHNNDGKKVLQKRLLTQVLKSAKKGAEKAPNNTGADKALINTGDDDDDDDDDDVDDDDDDEKAPNNTGAEKAPINTGAEKVPGAEKAPNNTGAEKRQKRCWKSAN